MRERENETTPQRRRTGGSHERKGHINPASTGYNESENTAEQERGSIGPVRQRQWERAIEKGGASERERGDVCVCV